jgi:hypothetical protein
MLQLLIKRIRYKGFLGNIVIFYQGHNHCKFHKKRLKLKQQNRCLFRLLLPTTRMSIIESKQKNSNT